MPKPIKTMDVRPKSALSTSWIHAKASPIADTVTEDTDTDLTSSAGEADGEWVARKFTATASAFLKSIGLVLGRTGTPAGTLNAYIYSDDGGTVSMPGSVIGGASDAVTSSGLSNAAGGAEATFTWTGSYPELVSGTDYWVVLKSTGYTYANGVTEIRWRTDANGAVGLNECAKCLLSTSPFWSTIGADVGSALTVTYETIPVTLGNADFLRLLVDFTIGSSAGMRLKLEVSDDLSTWHDMPNAALAGNIFAVGENPEWHIEATGTKEIDIGRVLSQYARVSVKALTSATSAECGVTAQVR